MATTPSAPPLFSALPVHSVQNEGNLREFLTEKQWPENMQNIFIKNLDSVPLRFFICDDSGSMAAVDGTIATACPGGFKPVKCSRWQELSSTMLFHAEAAHRGCIPSEFRFLNTGMPFHVGFDLSQSPENFENLRNILNGSLPGGGTPLCTHIREITYKIQAMESMLRAAGKKALIVIATDGEPSDGDVRDVLRPLKNLPVWIILRFCTNEDSIVKLWNNIDSELELNMDVIDDFFGEGKEIQKLNSWLVYGEPLHRMREFGVTLKELDNVDEKLLSVEDMLRVCKLILGPSVDSFPPPQVDFPAFLAELEKANALIPKVWSSRTHKMEHWILAKEVQKRYGGGGKCVIS